MDPTFGKIKTRNKMKCQNKSKKERKARKKMIKVDKPKTIEIYFYNLNKKF